MRGLLVSTYPSRECGIATFATDLRNAMCQDDGIDDVDVVGMANSPDGYEYGAEVVDEIRQHDLDDYRRAAGAINNRGYDVVCIQHEFGIFGGPAGTHVLELIKRLRAPVVVTLHTVLQEPPQELRNAMVAVAEAADRLVVLARKAVDILTEVYGVERRKIRVIPHGVPDVPFTGTDEYKIRIGAQGRLLLLTFGLLSRNKGIDVALEALPEVVDHHPDLLYLVLGATHPDIRRHEGEAYRTSLHEQVRRLGLTDNVVFHDRYVNPEELCEYIRACDIYLSPYQSREQIVSGTLAYVVGMGKAVVSTPYLYAEELLAERRGVLVPFGDPAGMARGLRALIADPEERERTAVRAYAYSRDMTWPCVGGRYRELFEELITEQRHRAGVRLIAPGAAAGLPALRLDHLASLTDDTGVMQHAKYGIPDRRFGYTTDDVSRALIAVLQHHDRYGDARALPLARNYLSFLQHAQRTDGRFRNEMSFARVFIDECGTEDTLGQSLWALGSAVQLAPDDDFRALADELLTAALPPAHELSHTRAMAYAVCGAAAVLAHRPGDNGARTLLMRLAERLADQFGANAGADWRWFDGALTYANAKVCEAMLHAGRLSDRDEWTRMGLESLDFVLAETSDGGRFDFVGNEGWYPRGGARATYGQQPIEAGYTAQACRTAFEVTGESRYLEFARSAVSWLAGHNRLGVALYEPATGACADGLERDGASRNRGAESTICCLLGMLAVAGTEIRLDEEPGLRTAGVH